MTSLSRSVKVWVDAVSASGQWEGRMVGLRCRVVVGQEARVD